MELGIGRGVAVENTQGPWRLALLARQVSQRREPTRSMHRRCQRRRAGASAKETFFYSRPSRKGPDTGQDQKRLRGRHLSSFADRNKLKSQYFLRNWHSKPDEARRRLSFLCF